MQQVRALGRMPKENHDPKEDHLAHDLRKARAAGFMTSYESELRELEVKDAEALAASTATEHAKKAEGLMQQVRVLGRMPKRNHDPKEDHLAYDLRRARAAGFMTSYESELRELEVKDAEALAASTATEHAKKG